MKDILGLLAIAIAFVAYVPYLRDIFAKRTVPHPYSWFVWGISSALIFALQLTHGGGPGSYVTGAMTVICIGIGLLAYRNGAYHSITRQDTVVFIIALTATGLWLFVHQPVLSILLLVGADLLATIPSVRKAWYKPYEETLSMWVINGGRHMISIMALQEYNIITVLDPSVWVVTNLAFSAMLIMRRRRGGEKPIRKTRHKRTPRRVSHPAK